jgi:hypothetical protein
VPIVSFDLATVAGSAPTRDALAAALPESERGSAASYLRHFLPEARYSNSDMYAPYWAKAYLANKTELDQAAESANQLTRVMNNVQTGRLFAGQTYPSPANMLVGMSDDDEFRIISLFDGLCTFGPGLSFLTEGDRLDRLESAFVSLNSSGVETSRVMDLIVAPAVWKRADDFDTLLFEALRIPGSPRMASRFMQAARAMSPGARAEDAAMLHARYTIGTLEQFAEQGIALEYALALT